MSTVDVIVLIVIMVVISMIAMLAIAPAIRDAATEVRVRRLREQQAQTEARLRMLSQFTIQRMHQAARQQPDDEL